MTTALFRHEATEARAERLTGAVIAATPPRAGVYAALAGVVALLFLLVAVFGQFASRVPVAGQVTYDRGFARIYPPAAAEVRAIHVRNGQAVAKGDPLVTVALAQGRDAEGEGIDSQLAQIAARDRELARQQALAGRIGAGDRDALAARAANLRTSIASIGRQQRLNATLVEIAGSEAARAGRLARANAGSRRQAEEARAAEVARAADTEQLRERGIAQADALRTVEAELAQRPLTVDRTLSELAAQRADLAAQRAALLRLDRLVLTAPIAGRVGDVLAEIGQRARPDASLVTVVPAGSRLEARLFTPTRAVGFARVGERVRLRFDAYPYEKFGAGIGRITDVAQVPVDAAGIEGAGIEGAGRSDGAAAGQPIFRVTVAIERGVLASDGGTYRLRPGMTLSTDLQLERRPLWQVLLAPVIRGWRR